MNWRDLQKRLFYPLRYLPARVIEYKTGIDKTRVWRLRNLELEIKISEYIKIKEFIRSNKCD